MGNIKKKNGEEFIAHYGVKGMKWGVRHEYEKVGRKESHETDSGTSGKLKLTDKQKRAIKIGATAAAATLAVCGTYYLYKTGKLDKLIDIGRRKTTDMLGTEKLREVDSITGFNKLGKNVSKSISENLKNCNPDGYTNNCKEVSLTYAVKDIFGVDICAKAQTIKGNLHDFMSAYFKDADVKTLTADRTNAKDRLTKQLLKRYSEGDVGQVAVTFDPKYIRAGAQETGHAFNWKILNGTVHFIDGQPDPPLEDASKYFNFVNASKEIEYVKINGLTPTELLKKAMRNR